MKRARGRVFWGGPAARSPACERRRDDWVDALPKWSDLGWGLNARSACADQWIVRSCGRTLRAPQMILQSLAGLPAFVVYFCTGVIAVIAYLLVYTRITPHDEFQLIRNNVPSAAIALGLSLLGFVLPVVSAIAHSVHVW